MAEINNSPPAEVLDLFELHALYSQHPSGRELEAWQEVALSYLIADGRVAQAQIEAAAHAGTQPGAADQAKLLRTARDGALAFEVFLHANRNMVGGIVQKLLPLGRGKVESDDPMQVGTVELARCIQNFDPSLGLKFSTYAYRNIHGRVLNWIQGNRRTIVLSASIEQNAHAFRTRVLKGEQPEAAAKNLRLSLQTLHGYEEAIRTPDALSYDIDIFRVDGSSAPFIDSLEDESAPLEEQSIPRVDARMIAAALKGWLAKENQRDPRKIGVDPERSYRILLARFGYEIPDSEIARQENISKQTVSKVVHAALKQIRDHLPEEIKRMC